jgi:hypothetical protein
MTPSIRISIFILTVTFATPTLIAQRAARIERVTPSAAHVGDLVTINGDGFGAINVSITVAGRPAAVIAANGNSVTFRIPQGPAPGAATVTATNPGGRTGSVMLQILEGVLLTGPANARATDAFADLLPTPANRADVDAGGLIFTRLSVTITPDATVAQVNAALNVARGGIVSMRPGDRDVTFAVPRQTSFDALAVLIETLKNAPGIAFVFPGRDAAPNDLPPGSQHVGDHLIPTRFPAAWNARRLAQRDCTTRRVPIIVADAWPASPPANLSGFSTQIPTASFTPATTAGFSPHGYMVTATLAAMFDDVAPTGANPFVECLDIRAVNIEGLTQVDAIDAVVRSFPAGKFILNYSIGFPYSCDFTRDDPVLHFPVCDPHWVKLYAVPAIERAKMAETWKRRSRARWQHFLATTSAGNSNDPLSPDGLLAWLYPGVATVLGNNWMSGATTDDPFFGFAAAHDLWDRTTPILDTRFDNLTASDLDMAMLRTEVGLDQLATVGGSDNTIVVGSTTGGGSFGDLQESNFSNRTADLLAVGEDVLMLDGTARGGTSFAAPQVAALASYLWLLSNDLRNLPDAIEATREAIEQNTRTIGSSSPPVIDAYATILSLDQTAAPSAATAPVRLAILDRNNDGFFTEADLERYVARLLDANGDPVSPSAPDYSEYDLNGDGFTGGDRLERFDLDRDTSTQFAANVYDVNVTQDIEGGSVLYDEHSLKDLDILCYYAYSPLYTGNVDRRKQLLPRCAGVTVEVSPSTASVSAGGTTQFAVTVHGTSDVRVTWSTDAPGATISGTGLYTAGATAGTFNVRATSVADPTKTGTARITITAPQPGHGSGSVKASAGAHAQNDPQCVDLAIKVGDVQSFSRQLHCTGTFETIDHRNLTGTADASTTFNETDLLGQVTDATATGSYHASTDGLQNPDLPIGQNNTTAESAGSYKLAFTVAQPRTVTLSGTLTGNSFSTFLQFSCGPTFGNQAGAGTVDRTFMVPAGELCVISVASTAKSRLAPIPFDESPAAGFDLRVTVR